jgi:hypothetical protein
MRKTRLWVCKKCGRYWHRKRKDKVPRIYCCGESVSAGRIYPKRRTSKYERTKEKIRKFKDEYEVKPRTNLGTVLRVSKETKKALRECLKMKTKPAFIRKADLFVKSIANDIHLYNTSKDKGGLWVKRINCNGDISKYKGGMTGMPIVRLSENDMYSTRGLYTTNFMKGEHSIVINCKEPLTEMPNTLVHEVLHFIDANCGMDCDGHGYYWKTRLERFKKMLNCRQIGY